MMPAADPRDDEHGRAAPDAAAPLPRFVYSTRGIAPAEQFAAWRAHCLPVIEMLPLAGVERGYAAEAEVWRIGHFALSHVTAQAAGFRRTAAMIRRDGLDHWIVNIAMSGRFRLRSGAGERILTPHVPCLLSLAQGFEGARDDIEWLALFIPRDAMPETATPLATGPLESPLAGLLGVTLGRIVARLPSMTASEAPRLEEMIAGLLGSCLAPPPREGEPEPERIAALHREQVLAIIRRELASPDLGPERICKLAGLSRSRLYRFFAPLGGVARAVQEERLLAAHAALEAAAGRTDIGRTGEAFGFADASSFSRAFRRRFGCTPSELLARPAPARPAPAPPRADGLAAALRRI